MPGAWFLFLGRMGPMGPIGPISCDGSYGFDGIDGCLGRIGLMGLILMMGQSLSERKPLTPHQFMGRHSLHPPPGSQTTEDSETGSAGHGRRLEIFAPHVHRPLARNPCETEGLPVLNPKEDFSNCLPCPAKRVSAHSVVDYAYAPHPAICGQTDQSAKEYKPQKYISTRQPMLQD